MGGAIAVHIAVKELIPLVGLAVIDVVEGNGFIYTIFQNCIFSWAY